MTKRSSPKQYRPAPPRLVVHLTPDGDALTAFAKGDAGAERLVLERLADSVLSGGIVNPSIQKIANAIMAEAILKGALPGKKAGRPSADAFRAHEAAYRYFELKDAGMRSGEALAVVRKEFLIDERQIARFVNEFRPMIGWFVEGRERFRAWGQTCDETGFEDYEASVRIDLNLRDGLPAVNTKPSTSQLLESARRVLEALREENSDINSPSIVSSDARAP